MEEIIVYKYKGGYYGPGDMRKLRLDVENRESMYYNDEFDDIMASYGMYTLRDVFFAMKNEELPIDDIIKEMEEAEDESFRDFCETELESFTITI